jgi:hypothetical protein
MTVNLSSKDPKWAWHEMTDTYYAQNELKAASGVKKTGRKNTHPVLHYSLSWHESDMPSPEQMKDAALATLKVLGLGEHEALITAHTDKGHPHVHIVVNTVHPTTGRTADLKFSKLELSRWAEAYEREHGLHCIERVKNNAERERQANRHLDADELLRSGGKKDLKNAPRTKSKAKEEAERWRRKRDIRNMGPDRLLGNDPDKTKPANVPSKRGKGRNGYLSPSTILLRLRIRERVAPGVPKRRPKLTPARWRAMNPQRRKLRAIFALIRIRRRPERGVPRVRRIKHQSPTRSQWLDRKDIVDRMKRLRAEREVIHKIERNATSDKHKQERRALWVDHLAALRQANAFMSKKFKPHWRNLYKEQKAEQRFIERASTLERAIFVFKNRVRLGRGKALTKREMHRAINNPGRLLDLLDLVHTKERTHLAQIQKADGHQYTGKAFDTYARRLDAMLSRHTDERQAQRTQQFADTRTVTFMDAKQHLKAERDLAQAAPAAARLPDLPPLQPTGVAKPPAPEKAPDAQPGPPAPTQAPKTDVRDASGPDVSDAFNQAAEPVQSNDEPLSRSDEIKRDMEQWRRNNPDRDEGREL